MTLLKDMFDFTPVNSWVENFNESTHNSGSRLRIFNSFELLPEVEESARIIFDRINRNQGRGFFITGLYGSGKTIFMAWLSAIMTETTLRKRLLDTKPEWGLDAFAHKNFLTINFTAIESPDDTLEQAFWQSATDCLRHLTPPITATLSNTDAYLDTFYNHTVGGIKGEIENWIFSKSNFTIEQLKAYDKEYQKNIIEQAVSALNIQLVQDRTTVVEKVKKLVDIAHSCGYEGVIVFIDELYLQLIQSDEHFNRGTAFLGQLAEAGLAGDQPFWVFGAVQEEIQAIARQAGRNYDTELMGRLSGQSGRFQSINIPVTQFHRIYNRRLFRENSKCIHKLAESFKDDLQPYYRWFTDFFKRYFREKEPVTDETKHFADLYPIHPFALYCLTAITNRGGRSRGALGFVQEFIEHRIAENADWKRIAVIDDVFDYEDLRNKIIQDDPEMSKYYGMFERFCNNARDEVIARAPYKRWTPDDQVFARNTSERLIKALIVLAMVKIELDVSRLNDALLLRWPGSEHDPAGTDVETVRLFEKISRSFPALRHKGGESNPIFFLSIEGDGGEREELLVEVERVVNGFTKNLQFESAYRSQIELFFRFPGSPLGGTVPPQRGFSSQVKVEWQRTDRYVDYRLEPVNALTSEHDVVNYIKTVPDLHALHMVMLYPSTLPLDVEIDNVRYGNSRVLIWLPDILRVQDVDEIRRSMALVKLFSDYQSQVNAGGVTQSVRRKYELLGEWINLPAGSKTVQPTSNTIKIFLDSMVNGEIRQWNSKEQVWETLCDSGKLLSHFNSIPQSERSIAQLVEKISLKALNKVFLYHPNFREKYSFTADLSPIIRRRILDAIWKGRVTGADGYAMGDLEKYLSPLGLINTTVPGEISVTLGAGSVEAFRKAKDRIRDCIRKSSTQEVSIVEVRKRLRTTDIGLINTWVDIIFTLLISIGEMVGVTTEGKVVSQDDKTLGTPVDWIDKLAELRLGARPDEILWNDLTKSLEILGLWNNGTAYSVIASDRLMELLRESEIKAKEEYKQIEQLLKIWSGIYIPEPIADLVDIVALPIGSGSRIECFTTVRSAMQDILKLPNDNDIEDINRYTCIDEYANRLIEARDFICRVQELASLTNKLHELSALNTPEIIKIPCQQLLADIETYMISLGTIGEINKIFAEWKDLHELYINQYISEHAGLHKDLKTLSDKVIASPEYIVLSDLSMVDGLSAHYSPQYVQHILEDLLNNIGVDNICEMSLDDLKHNLETEWVCSSCEYRLGNKMNFDVDKYLNIINLGIKEYVDYIRGYAVEIQDYVNDVPEASILLGLMNELVIEDSFTALHEESMRQHLSKALVDATVVKINVDNLLKEIKPRIIGFYKNGQKDFESSLNEGIKEVILNYGESAHKEQPWKVE
ncbi:DUF4504 domain-containing protein [Clostridium estertheticum]|uniref:DUF4504 domain-containing protein n=1 Tax=Clostridium estertheticum TaxID=238834 RepID=UPI001CF5C7C5|nr:DUF4504 domain-containing protein [Clostridium estertheticum]MCB2305629.1 DUF4504 domain-containing protein [Clostridium estertheticum]MCB2344555.1 DUF4504 domain-containing protein [Clostridium estertheticum]MCB2347985.1 DUF4504 domain-containing protein [Clostridium estertheticum]WAG45629.1 DUF4504 domain-containing protein [Clostridium estertheticum]